MKTKCCSTCENKQIRTTDEPCNTCITEYSYNGVLPSYTPRMTNADNCEVDSSPIMVAGTTCQICDEFIPVYEYQHAYPRICDECKKRLKKLLYGESEGE